MSSTAQCSYLVPTCNRLKRLNFKFWALPTFGQTGYKARDWQPKPSLLSCPLLHPISLLWNLIRTLPLFLVYFEDINFMIISSSCTCIFCSGNTVLPKCIYLTVFRLWNSILTPWSTILNYRYSSFKSRESSFKFKKLFTCSLQQLLGEWIKRKIYDCYKNHMYIRFVQVQLKFP